MMGEMTEKHLQVHRFIFSTGMNKLLETPAIHRSDREKIATYALSHPSFIGRHPHSISHPLEKAERLD